MRDGWRSIQAMSGAVLAAVAVAWMAGPGARASRLPTAEDSWDAIRAMDNIWIGSGTVFDAEMGGIFNICTDGENLRTIRPIQACVASQSDRTGPAGRGRFSGNCVRMGTREIVHPLLQRMSVCARSPGGGSAGRGGGGGCERYGTATYRIPTTVDLEVGVEQFTNSAYPMNMSYQLFFKPYTIPFCGAHN